MISMQDTVSTVPELTWATSYYSRLFHVILYEQFHTRERALCGATPNTYNWKYPYMVPVPDFKKCPICESRLAEARQEITITEYLDPINRACACGCGQLLWSNTATYKQGHKPK